MNEPTMKELQEQIRQLRNLLLTLSATLLRESAIETKEAQGPASAYAERLVRKADDCFLCAKIPGLKREIAAGLEAAGYELMAKAVEIDAGLDKSRAPN